MKKRDFIQQASIQFLFKTGEKPCAETAINYAERLWSRLGQRGYGEPKQHQPRDTTNWYQKLTAKQADHFDKFWAAYNYKTGKQGAAMRWFKLGELQENDYLNIIQAASQEAENRLQKQQNGITPIMAQGWLTERRWEDNHETTLEKKQNTISSKQKHIREMAQELAHLQKINATAENKAISEQISALQNKIAEAKQ